MRTPEEELTVLRRRYIRMLKFDRILFAIYSVTALIPIYALFTHGHDRMFHAVGALLIAAVGAAGVAVDTRILRGEEKTECAAYSATVGLIVSRFALSVWGIWIIYPRMMTDIMREVFGSSEAFAPITLSEAVGRALDVVFDPAFIWVLFPVAFYRVLYHISVHFLLRIQKMETEPSRSRATPLTRPEIRESLSQSHARRGVYDR